MTGFIVGTVWNILEFHLKKFHACDTGFFEIHAQKLLYLSKCPKIKLFTHQTMGSTRGLCLSLSK